MGFKKNKNNIPIINTEIAMGKKISKIEYPKFLIDTNSLLLIKFLIKKDMLIIVTKGIISFKIDGYFKKERYKKLNKPFSFPDNILDNSKRFKNIINNEIIKKFINRYLLVRLNK